MNQIRIGIICPSEIAFRRFMPSVQKCDDSVYIDVAYANAGEWFGRDGTDTSVIENDARNVRPFADKYGDKVFGSYEERLNLCVGALIFFYLSYFVVIIWQNLSSEAGCILVVL